MSQGDAMLQGRVDVQDLKQFACFGVAGNFTGHLEQAGEASSFAQVKTQGANAPKAVFPTYVPNVSARKGFIFEVFPFDEEQIVIPRDSDNFQIEPECGILFKAHWNKDTQQLESLEALAFAASNDCSLRVDGAKKISEKKNWGEFSKGFATTRSIAIDSFAPGGVLDRYRIASFLIREGKVYPYGEDSAIKDYNYFYDTLTDWLIDRFNHQKDEGPAEDLHSYLKDAGYPECIMVSVGATRYTDFGEHNFLQHDDRAVVVLYPGDVYSKEEIIHKVEINDLNNPDISVLNQKITVQTH